MKLVIANWKCNPATQEEAERFFDMIEERTKKLGKIRNLKIVICPPFVWLSGLRGEIPNLRLGGQDCHWEQSGAYTGEVSPKMLKDLGCDYVIVGHSERREYFNETNEIINKKLLAALKTRLKPILCVGEKEDEEMGLIIKNQLIEGLKAVNRIQMQNIIIAYEPVWAIGTKNPCQPDDAMRAALFIRKILNELYNRKLAEETAIIYGGSVNSKIVLSYIKEAGMDGLLIGKASLDISEFIKIIEQVNG